MSRSLPSPLGCVSQRTGCAGPERLRRTTVVLHPVLSANIDNRPPHRKRPRRLRQGNGLPKQRKESQHRNRGQHRRLRESRQTQGTCRQRLKEAKRRLRRRFLDYPLLPNRAERIQKQPRHADFTDGFIEDPKHLAGEALAKGSGIEPQDRSVHPPLEAPAGHARPPSAPNRSFATRTTRFIFRTSVASTVRPASVR